jgi:ribosome-associated heat shock protein Hsp15
MTTVKMTNKPTSTQQDSGDGAQEVRLDRWLWAARFFKTRQLSVGALKAGKVTLNGRKAKPARAVRIGDQLSVRRDQYCFDVEVLELREKRVGAELARQMFRETPESIERRRRLEEQLETERRVMRFPDGRPGKKDRRALERFKRAET